jgi:MoxR-like ATPase
MAAATERLALTMWPVYRGQGPAHAAVDGLPAPPNWRSTQVDGSTPMPVPDVAPGYFTPRLGASEGIRRATDRVRDMVNAALFLRRPLLVTGHPGSGKSTLAYDVAFELGLGPVLRWPINSRSALRDGLYVYDALGRLRDENIRHLREQTLAARTGTMEPTSSAEAEPLPIGRHVKLGPLGTAFLNFERPRVLLIDEIDKSDLDLPNDLLEVFEEGSYEIPELARIAKEESVVEVRTADESGRADITGGIVRVQKFPFVIMTSNGERDFPPAFLRRCLRLDLGALTAIELARLVEAQLGPDVAEQSDRAIELFLNKQERGMFAADQLLNALYLTMSGMREFKDHGALDPAVVNAAMQSLVDRDLIDP